MVKCSPLIVTEVPPAAGPVLGSMLVTTGWTALSSSSHAATLYVNWSAAPVALVPLGVVTVTSTLPLPAGETAVIEVAELTVKLVAFFSPNLTVVAPLRLVPVTVTDVPPAVLPTLGSTLVTVGAADRKVN
jgi:hypothetical protein